MLEALADNGGPTLTHALQTSSPAIDAGNSTLQSDQRGFLRPFNIGSVADAVGSNGSDIGAFEFIEGLASVESVVFQDGSAQRSVIREITVTFDSIVNVEDGAFVVANSAGQTADVSAALSVVDGKTQAVLTFSGALTDSTGSLIDGQYSLTIVDQLVTDESGNFIDADGDGVTGDNLRDDFFRLYGDADGDGNVGFFDYALFRNALFSDDGDDDFSIAFDANGDGTIDLMDIQAFRDNFGASVKGSNG